MRERMEFRIPEENAQGYLRPNDGVRIGRAKSVRKIKVSRDDPLFEQILAINRDFHERGDSFFLGWTPHRSYSKRELLSAETFQIEMKNCFEPPGEVCGTVYDDSRACPLCGAGGKQISHLKLDLRKVPRTKQMAVTIANEIVVSEGLADDLINSALTGFELRRVQHKASYDCDPIDLNLVPSGREILKRAEVAGISIESGQFDVWLNLPETRPLWHRAVSEHSALQQINDSSARNNVGVWYQVVITGNPVRIVSPTRVGINPGDEDHAGEFRCPNGDTLGLNLLSELSVSRQDYEQSARDITVTQQCVGARRGLLRPRQLIVVSPRFKNFVEQHRIRGVAFEITYLN